VCRANLNRVLAVGRVPSNRSPAQLVCALAYSALPVPRIARYLDRTHSRDVLAVLRPEYSSVLYRVSRLRMSLRVRF